MKAKVYQCSILWGLSAYMSSDLKPQGYALSSRRKAGDSHCVITYAISINDSGTFGTKGNEIE